MSTLDAKTLEGLRMLEEATGTTLLADLTRTFRDDTPKRVAGLRDALEKGDADGLKRIAHSLRGSAGALGALELFAAATELERAVDREPAGRWGPLVDAIDSLAVRAIEALEHEVTASTPKR
jgi:HPt (histidine-containing phosphotransfer) domain-containing protein